jgi:hypothetical protein
MDLWQDFLTNDDNLIHKWVHYFPAYEKHFQPWRNRAMTFLEIGVSRGGSLAMWQRYFGPRAKIVGIDINPDCKRHERPGIEVRIGDQSDPEFLASLIEEFGVPDVVLDDGSHIMDHVIKTFDFFYPKLPKNGVYMVEDMHTAYWKHYGGGLHEEKSFVNVSKHFIDQLNAHCTRGEIAPNQMTRDTYCISFYDSIVAFDKGGVHWREAIITGKKNTEVDLTARRLGRKLRRQAARDSGLVPQARVAKATADTQQPLAVSKGRKARKAIKAQSEAALPAGKTPRKRKSKTPAEG